MSKQKTEQKEIPQWLLTELDNLPATYPQLAMATNNKELHFNKQLWQSMSGAYPQIMEACMKADRLKASLVYGTKNKEFAHQAFPAPKAKLGTNELMLLHAILGVISEGGELLERFMKDVDAGRRIDRTNILEEAGDLNWFLQLIILASQSRTEEVQQMNILKLWERFEGKFDHIKATHRNVEAERQSLEDNEK